MVNAFVFMQKVFLLDFEWAMKLYIFSGAYFYKDHFHLLQQNHFSLGYISLVCEKTGYEDVKFPSSN